MSGELRGGHHLSNNLWPCTLTSINQYIFFKCVVCARVRGKLGHFFLSRYLDF